jgi:hypothetical protein
LAPSESMQFGRTLQRLLQHLVEADPRYGPTHLIKIDISDGFYRVQLNPTDAPVLGVAFPPAPDGTPLVAIPLTLPMGWVLSPPYFTAATETIADLANKQMKRSYNPGPHRLDSTADAPDTSDPPLAVGATTQPATAITPVPLPRRASRGFHQRPLSYTDVYMDDFIGAVQGGPQRQQRARRIIFDTIDSVFRPLSPTDGKNRQEPISIKKLQKGDARWSTRKTVLGWTLDTVRETIELPQRRLDRLQTILDSLPRSKTRIAASRWHQVLGELRSMTLAVPGLRGFFSLLQEALRHVHQKRIRLTSSAHDFLDDIRWLVQSLHTRPTRFREVVPTDVRVLGACDACQQGMGGVMFLPAADEVAEPVLWRAPFPLELQRQLVSWANPTGVITNSDLELAGTIAQHDVLVNAMDVRECTIATLTDNTPAQAWQGKGSATTTGPAAYLLRLQAIHQRHHRYLPVIQYIPGPANAMADDCSRRWDLNDAELLTLFNTCYPQTKSWRLCHLRQELHSSLTSALQKQRPAPESMLPLKTKQTGLGQNGYNSAETCTRTQPSHLSAIPLHSSKFSPNGSATADPPAAVTLSAIARYLTPSVRWARRSPYWGPRTRDSTPRDT